MFVGKKNVLRAAELRNIEGIIKKLYVRCSIRNAVAGRHTVYGMAARNTPNSTVRCSWVFVYKIPSFIKILKTFIFSYFVPKMFFLLYK